MKLMIRYGIPLACLLVVSGCANTLKYADAIDRFADGAKQAERAIKALSAPKSGERDRLRAIALTAPAKISIQGCAAGANECTIRVEDTGGSKRPLEARNAVPKTVQLAVGIRNYADALKAIAIADREQEINVALNSVTKGVGAIANVFGSSVSPTPTVGNRIIGYFTAQYLDTIKLDALKIATTKAEESLGDTTAFFSTIRLSFLQDDITRAHDDYQEARSAFNNSKKLPRPTKLLDNYETTAKKLNTLLEMREVLKDKKKPSVFDNLRSAHSALHKALTQKTKSSFDSALSQIDFYVREAEKLVTIIEQLE